MLEEKIMQDYKQAMKDRDSLKVATLSFLRAQLKNLAIEKRQDTLTDADVMIVVKKLTKQRKDSIEQFISGNRQDLVDKETQELEILKGYLPEQISEGKIKEAIEEIIKATGADKISDMSKVMKELLPKLAGKSDNKLVSELVRQRLASGG